MKNLLKISLLLFVLSSCNFKPEESAKKVEKDPYTEYQYYTDGKVKAEIHIDNLKRFHGEVKKFYPDGKLKTLVTYDHGVTLNSKQYYENGKLEMEFPYKEGKKHGKRSKYWESGKIKSVLEYRNGEPIAGLKEYKESGKEVTAYPSLKIEQINQLSNNGKYYIDVYFSSNPQKGTYYIGELQNGLIPADAEKINSIKGGKGRIVLNAIPSHYNMKKLNIIGRFKTGYGSIYITEATFNL
ncbi:hypothetical protein GCM10011506_44730 [Marivirga lumbricoides]|uniref:Toxin-antitoxin system YwqK family antitoxin n=1 Tax=Marivirga lumbricoides TaxID=1046115 RepID=A0ABQ1N5S8_9BACT|nr:hypothetical protein GCM10011506_44730 [Marivirga lumbricoides]